MTIRNIRKNLAGMEDLLQGVGTEEQARGNATYVLGKVDVPYAVDTVAKMQALDITVFTRARVYSSTTEYVDYIYDAAALSGVTPAEGAGYWVVDMPWSAVTRLTGQSITTTPVTILDASAQGKKWRIDGMHDAATCLSSFSCEVISGATPVVTNVVNQAGAAVTYVVTVSGTDIQLATSAGSRSSDLVITAVIA